MGCTLKINGVTITPLQHDYILGQHVFISGPQKGEAKEMLKQVQHDFFLVQK
jgi:hypothetical protein